MLHIKTNQYPATYVLSVMIEEDIISVMIEKDIISVMIEEDIISVIVRI